ncbi:MAG: hypothetical protein ACRCZU_05395 [Selenomonadaceae bacterium]
MNQYYFRKVTKNDIARIVEVYNSNKKFLVNHLGDESIDASFINNELAEMERINFLSYVIIDAQKEIIVGVIDYKPNTSRTTRNGQSGRTERRAGHRPADVVSGCALPFGQAHRMQFHWPTWRLNAPGCPGCG